MMFIDRSRQQGFKTLPDAPSFPPRHAAMKPKEFYVFTEGRSA
jgi:hypothetical protein